MSGTKKLSDKSGPMYSIPLQLVLLLAVATSQILGGVSCCCLTRELSASWTKAGSVGALNGQERLAASKPGDPKCPKCAASRAANASNTKKGKSDGSRSVSDNNQCRCAKIAAPAGVQTESFSLSVAPHALATSTVIGNAIPTVKADVARRYEKPVRFGGHSWQSVACIWKN